MKENTIVSLADEKYFNLLEELIDSIKLFFHSSLCVCQKQSKRSNTIVEINIKWKRRFLIN